MYRVALARHDALAQLSNSALLTLHTAKPSAVRARSRGPICALRARLRLFLLLLGRRHLAQHVGPRVHQPLQRTHLRSRQGVKVTRVSLWGAVGATRGKQKASRDRCTHRAHNCMQRCGKLALLVTREGRLADQRDALRRSRGDTCQSVGGCGRGCGCDTWQNSSDDQLTERTAGLSRERFSAACSQACERSR